MKTENWTLYLAMSMILTEAVFMQWLETKPVWIGFRKMGREYVGNVDNCFGEFRYTRKEKKYITTRAESIAKRGFICFYGG
jgi:hypothetical protein